ncbi:MAG: hypothetical protein ACRCWD_02645 [Culicoidibacterales bacterium]
MKTKTLILVVAGVEEQDQAEKVLSELHSVTGVVEATIAQSYKTVTVTYNVDTLHSGQQIIDAITKTGVEVL